jgi:hypothetical protein
VGEKGKKEGHQQPWMRQQMANLKTALLTLSSEVYNVVSIKKNKQTSRQMNISPQTVWSREDKM